MKLHPIIQTHDTKTNWCGPAALAAITGMGTGAAREICKQAIKEELGRDNRRLQGIYTDELLKAIELYSIKHERKFSTIYEKAPSLATALHQFRPVAGNLLLIFIREGKNTGGHVIVTDGEKVVDSWYPNGVTFWNCSHMEKRCMSIYELSDITCEDL